MINEFGVHVGVGEVCAASGPAQRKTAMAGISGRIATVRVRITFSISKPVYQTRPSLVKLPITPGSGRVPRAGEGAELRLAYLPARFAKKNVVIGVRIKRRIEIDEIDARVGKFFPIRKPFQIIAEIK